MTGSGGSRRFEILDARPVNLDAYAVPVPEEGICAFGSPHDPEPSLLVEDGRVVEIDGCPLAEMDMIDAFLAEHAFDLDVVDAAMAMPDVEVARALVDTAHPREEITRLVWGMTPAKIARVVSLMTPTELQMAVSKMHVRRTPSIQAHVTNQADDPVLIAADAAAAVAHGFRELETTVPVLGDAPSNAVALLIGSQVGAPGALTQCSIEEALELELGLRGLTTYAETVSLYGTDQAFVDGDDTPWSKCVLAAAYASRGLKMRVTSGGGAEILMGSTQGCSSIYLEARCVVLARALGVQGVQNGGIDGVGIVAALPGGMRSLLAENLMVMMCGLESCSGNDTLISESDIRRSAHTVPLLLAGSDFIFSGYGSIPRYDNTFALSNFNADDLDDYLVLQRDWGVDGGLRARQPEDVARVRRQAAQAVVDVYRELGLADFSDAHVDEVVLAHGSRDVTSTKHSVVVRAAALIDERGLTVTDVISALERTGHDDIAGNIRELLRARQSGDHLQTAAIFDEDMRVLSALTDPNDYTGPGTGYRPDDQRQQQIDTLRSVRTMTERARPFAEEVPGPTLCEVGEAAAGTDPAEVVVGVTPAFGTGVTRTTSGMSSVAALEEIVRGVEEAGGRARVVRVTATIDLGAVGKAAAALSGSGVAVGIQGKGTAIISRAGMSPLANLELLSVSPLVTPEMYRTLGRNAAERALGRHPEAILWGGTDESISSRYHALSVALVHVERRHVRPGAPVELALEERS